MEEEIVKEFRSDEAQYRALQGLNHKVASDKDILRRHCFQKLANTQLSVGLTQSANRVGTSMRKLLKKKARGFILATFEEPFWRHF